MSEAKDNLVIESQISRLLNCQHGTDTSGAMSDLISLRNKIVTNLVSPHSLADQEKFREFNVAQNGPGNHRFIISLDEMHGHPCLD